jgi:hypothetical protein
MTVSGAWSRYRKAQPPKPLIKTLQLAYVRPLPIISIEPTRAEFTASAAKQPTVPPPSLARVLQVPGALAGDRAGDRSNPVPATQNVITD